MSFCSSHEEQGTRRLIKLAIKLHSSKITPKQIARKKLSIVNFWNIGQLLLYFDIDFRVELGRINRRGRSCEFYRETGRKSTSVSHTRWSNSVVIENPDSFQPTGVIRLFTIGKKPECIVLGSSCGKDARHNRELAAWNRRSDPFFTLSILSLSLHFPRDIL